MQRLELTLFVTAGEENLFQIEVQLRGRWVHNLAKGNHILSFYLPNFDAYFSVQTFNTIYSSDPRGTRSLWHWKNEVLLLGKLEMPVMCSPTVDSPLGLFLRRPETWRLRPSAPGCGRCCFRYRQHTGSSRAPLGPKPGPRAGRS